MTHEEFVGKLCMFFSPEQIAALENFGYESAVDAHEGCDEVMGDKDLLWFMGREFVCTYLWDCVDVEEVNAVLPDKHHMSIGKFCDMVDAMDAYGEEW